MTRPTWWLRFGIVVGVTVHVATVAFAQDARPSQTAYFNPGPSAAAGRMPASRTNPGDGVGGASFAMANDDRGQPGGRSVSPPSPGIRQPGGLVADESAAPLPGGPIPLDLATALRWTLAHNPGLVTTRQNLAVSAAAVAVAQRFPTSLNPSVSIDTLPWTFESVPGGGVTRVQPLVAVTWSQPIELGHRQSFRESIASAQYDQTHWNILQAELTTMVQTYRLHQTATYRRQKFETAERLTAFDQRMADVLRRRMEANQAPAADVVLADVEAQVADQKAAAAQQEYFAALSALRQQIGNPDYAVAAEPVGNLRCPDGVAPGGEDALIDVALASQPEIRAAEAQVSASRAALCLARADRIPIPSLGPHYEKDESGTTFYGMSLSTPVPIWNAGRTLVTQREAEYRRDCVALDQDRQRVIAAVKASLVRWNQARLAVARTEARLAPIKEQSARMERLFTANDTDIIKMLQVEQRSIDADDAYLDVLSQATDAYADLIATVGIAPLLASLPTE
jgi:outer membrane protein, heavy metal efflux system